MKNKNEKGFALVLSLTLLLVMSLLGGSLIVITSGDHQSNNTSDEYQQSFYVAETALLEAEKYLLNQMMGPWVEPNDANVPLQANADAAEHAAYIKTLEDNKVGDMARNLDGRYVPINVEKSTGEPDYVVGDRVSGLDTSTQCFKSYRNILNRDNLKVVVHKKDQSFADLIIFPLLEAANYNTIDATATDNEMEKEKERMEDYKFEYFILNIGESSFKGEGSSLKKSTTNIQRKGTSYKIFGCGYLERGLLNEIDILVPLETILVLSS